MDSIWWKNSERPHFNFLSGDTETEVLIVGGGIAGILTAYMLGKANIPYILVEANKICSGITKNTTAKITLGHGFIYSKLISRFGADAAKLYYAAQCEALSEYEKLCSSIPSDYEKTDAYVYSFEKRLLEDELNAITRLKINADFSKAEELPFEASGAVHYPGQAQFNPLKFLFGISAGLKIYEDTKVLEFLPDCAITNRGKIKFKKAIVATHFPILNKHGAYFLKMYQHRSYVIALTGAEKISGAYVDQSDKGLSFRSYGDKLLIGGGDHRTGKRGGGWAELEAFAKRYYKNAKIIARWATQDCMTLDGIPYIGRYSKNAENIYVATGFNKWGMSSAMLSASLLCDMISGKKNEYEALFNPSRSILRPQLAVNIAESLLGFLTPGKPRCPHLGCALKYNKAERSWDCPCHGSRFTEEGKLIDNPATDGKKI